MRLLDALRCLLALLLLPTAAVQASAAQPVNGTVLPSTSTLAGCQKSCGNVSFEYPFGIGPGCFRSQDFELFCSSHGSSQDLRLFLHDGVTEVAKDIRPDSTQIEASFSHSISLRSEVDAYSKSWNLGTSFNRYDSKLHFTGCDFDMHVLEFNTSNTVGQCSAACPDEGITGRAARQNCNGTGCCFAYISSGAKGFDIKFVRRRMGNGEAKAHSNRSSIWDDEIEVATDYALIEWAIALDQPVSDGTLQHRTDYACFGNHSSWESSESDFSYFCRCDRGYQGNAYISDGCSRDKDVVWRRTSERKSSVIHAWRS